MAQQQLVLFRTEHSGVFAQKESSNLEQINELLRQGWRIVSMSPTSSPSTNVGVYPDVFALVLLEK
jgi:hypothetical protein